MKNKSLHELQLPNLIYLTGLSSILPYTTQLLTSDSSVKVLQRLKAALQLQAGLTAHKVVWEKFGLSDLPRISQNNSPGWYSTGFLEWDGPFFFFSPISCKTCFPVSSTNRAKIPRIIIFRITKPWLFPSADPKDTQNSPRPKRFSQRREDERQPNVACLSYCSVSRWTMLNTTTAA